MDVEISPLNRELFVFETGMYDLESQVIAMQKNFNRMVAEYHKMKLMGASANQLFQVQIKLSQTRFAIDESLFQLAQTHHMHRELVYVVEQRLAKEES